MGRVKQQMMEHEDMWWNDATNIMENNGCESCSEFVSVVFKQLGDYPNPNISEEEIIEKLSEDWEEHWSEY